MAENWEPDWGDESPIIMADLAEEPRAARLAPSTLLIQARITWIAAMLFGLATVVVLGLMIFYVVEGGKPQSWVFGLLMVPVLVVACWAAVLLGVNRGEKGVFGHAIAGLASNLGVLMLCALCIPFMMGVKAGRDEARRRQAGPKAPLPRREKPSPWSADERRRAQQEAEQRQRRQQEIEERLREEHEALQRRREQLEAQQRQMAALQEERGIPEPRPVTSPLRLAEVACQPVPIEAFEQKSEPADEPLVDVESQQQGARVVFLNVEAERLAPGCIWSADGKHLFLLQNDGKLLAISRPDFTVRRRLDLKEPCSRLLHSQAGLIVVAQRGALFVVDPETLAATRRMSVTTVPPEVAHVRRRAAEQPHGTAGPWTVVSAGQWATSPKSPYLVTLMPPRGYSNNAVVLLVDVNSGSVTGFGTSQPLSCPAVTPDGKYLFVANQTSLVRFALGKGRITYERTSTPCGRGPVETVISPDSERIALICTMAADDRSGPPRRTPVLRVDRLESPEAWIATPNASTMSLEPATRRVFVSGNGRGGGTPSAADPLLIFDGGALRGRLRLDGTGYNTDLLSVCPEGNGLLVVRRKSTCFVEMAGWKPQPFSDQAGGTSTFPNRRQGQVPMPPSAATYPQPLRTDFYFSNVRKIEESLIESERTEKGVHFAVLSPGRLNAAPGCVWSQDGKRLFVLDPRRALLEVSVPDCVVRRSLRLSYLSESGSLAVSRMGLVIGQRQRLSLVDPRTMSLRKTVSVPNYAGTLAGSPAVPWVIMGDGQRLALVDLASAELLSEMQVHNGSIPVVTPDGESIFSASSSKLQRYGVQDQRLVVKDSRPLQGGSLPRGMAVTADAEYLVIASGSRSGSDVKPGVYRFDADNFRGPVVAVEIETEPFSFALDPVTRQLYVQTAEHFLTVFSAEGRRLKDFAWNGLGGERPRPGTLWVHPDGRQLLVLGERLAWWVDLRQWEENTSAGP